MVHLRLIGIVFDGVEDGVFGARGFLSALIVALPREARQIRVDCTAVRFFVDFQDILALGEGCARSVDHAARAIEASPHLDGLRLGQIPVWTIDGR